MIGKTEKIGRQLSEEERIVLTGLALFKDDLRESFIWSALRAIEREKTKGRRAEVINLAEWRFKSCTK